MLSHHRHTAASFNHLVYEIQNQSLGNRGLDVLLHARCNTVASHISRLLHNRYPAAPWQAWKNSSLFCQLDRHSPSSGPCILSWETVAVSLLPSPLRVRLQVWKRGVRLHLKQGMYCPHRPNDAVEQHLCPQSFIARRPRKFQSDASGWSLHHNHPDPSRHVRTSGWPRPEGIASIAGLPVQVRMIFDVTK